ncbi:hypothetical protein [Pandoravirus japonicus]|uniref:Uncharacterized protein n=1 Tax=Pandoravirus japonicus TaxID=2823154 RepID=A0A811BTD0_9VIRU|nr:hypothetical protein [Pandoravirus japonicus]
MPSSPFARPISAPASMFGVREYVTAATPRSKKQSALLLMGLGGGRMIARLRPVHRRPPFFPQKCIKTPSLPHRGADDRQAEIRTGRER